MYIFFLDRVKYVAFFQSKIFKPFKSEEVTREKDFKLIAKKVKFYRRTLGFPEKRSEDFKSLSKALQDEVLQFHFTKEDLSKASGEKDTDDSGKKDDDSDSECHDEDIECSEEVSLPWLDIKLAKDKPYKFVSTSLKSVLPAMEKTALKILKEVAARSELELGSD